MKNKKSVIPLIERFKKEYENDEILCFDLVDFSEKKKKVCILDVHKGEKKYHFHIELKEEIDAIVDFIHEKVKNNELLWEDDIPDERRFYKISNMVNVKNFFDKLVYENAHNFSETEFIDFIKCFE